MGVLLLLDRAKGDLFLDLLSRDELDGNVGPGTPKPGPSTLLSSIHFPRQEPGDGPRRVMEAELVGKLMVMNDCLRVESVYNGESYLPV